MSEVCEKPSSAANIPIEVGGSLTWQKLSPAEFQQLQDFMACKYFFPHQFKKTICCFTCIALDSLLRINDFLWIKHYLIIINKNLLECMF